MVHRQKNGAVTHVTGKDIHIHAPYTPTSSYTVHRLYKVQYLYFLSKTMKTDSVIQMMLPIKCLVASKMLACTA